MDYLIRRLDFKINNLQEYKKLDDFLKTLNSPYVEVPIEENSDSLGIQKICSYCKVSKDATKEFFFKDKSRKDSLSCICKDCKRMANSGLSVDEIRAVIE
jgi:hypothetical protein